MNPFFFLDFSESFDIGIIQSIKSVTGSNLVMFTHESFFEIMVDKVADRLIIYAPNPKLVEEHLQNIFLMLASQTQLAILIDAQNRNLKDSVELITNTLQKAGFNSESVLIEEVDTRFKMKLESLKEFFCEQQSSNLKPISQADETDQIRIFFSKITESGPSIIMEDASSDSTLGIDKSMLLSLATNLSIIFGQGHQYVEGVITLPLKQKMSHKIIALTLRLPDQSNIVDKRLDIGAGLLGLIIPNKQFEIFMNNYIQKEKGLLKHFKSYFDFSNLQNRPLSELKGEMIDILSTSISRSN